MCRMLRTAVALVSLVPLVQASQPPQRPPGPGSTVGRGPGRGTRSSEHGGPSPSNAEPLTALLFLASIPNISYGGRRGTLLSFPRYTPPNIYWIEIYRQPPDSV